MDLSIYSGVLEQYEIDLIHTLKNPLTDLEIRDEPETLTVELHTNPSSFSRTLTLNKELYVQEITDDNGNLNNVTHPRDEKGWWLLGNSGTFGYLNYARILKREGIIEIADHQYTPPYFENKKLQVVIIKFVNGISTLIVYKPKQLINLKIEDGMEFLFGGYLYKILNDGGWDEKRFHICCVYHDKYSYMETEEKLKRWLTEHGIVPKHRTDAPF